MSSPTSAASSDLGAADADAPPGTSDREETRAWYRAVVAGLVAMVVSRLAVLAGAGVRASQMVVDTTAEGLPRPRSATSLITGVLTSWDGRWYLEIVRGGYPRSVPSEITYEQLEARSAFFPLYPNLVRALDRIMPGGDTMAAVVLNLALSFTAVVLVGLLARRLTNVATARRAMVLFAVFPGSFVLSFAYSEALLIVLAAACLIFLVDERWLLAGLAGALATAARPNGLAVVAACAVAAVIAIRRRGDWWALLAPLLAPLGFVGFQLFLWQHTGERNVWFRVQREAWREGTSFGATAISNTLSFLTHPLASPTDAITAASIVAMLGALYCLWKRPLPAPVTAYVIVVLVLMLLPATVTARPRFLFTAFPLVIAVAAWWPRAGDAHPAAEQRSPVRVEAGETGWELLMVSCGAGLAALTALYGVFGAIP